MDLHPELMARSLPSSGFLTFFPEFLNANEALRRISDGYARLKHFGHSVIDGSSRRIDLLPMALF
jgi:hypothetical protein